MIRTSTREWTGCLFGKFDEICPGYEYWLVVCEMHSGRAGTLRRSSKYPHIRHHRKPSPLSPNELLLICL